MSIISKVGTAANKGIRSYTRNTINKQREQRKQDEYWKKVNKRQDKWLKNALKK